MWIFILNFFSKSVIHVPFQAKYYFFISIFVLKKISPHQHGIGKSSQQIAEKLKNYINIIGQPRTAPDSYWPEPCRDRSSNTFSIDSPVYRTIVSTGTSSSIILIY
jgi:hypothetical protein